MLYLGNGISQLPASQWVAGGQGGRWVTADQGRRGGIASVGASSGAACTIQGLRAPSSPAGQAEPSPDEAPLAVPRIWERLTRKFYAVDPLTWQRLGSGFYNLLFASWRAKSLEPRTESGGAGGQGGAGDWEQGKR